MRDGHAYKTVELTGTSSSTIEAAIQNAIETASATLRHLRWFEVIETRGDIESETIIHWQVTLKVGFRLEPPDGVAVDRRLAVFGKGQMKLQGGKSKSQRRANHTRRVRR